jgi:threonine synthase
METGQRRKEEQNMTFRLVCSACKQEYDPASLVWRCTCGGLLDLAEFPVSFPLEHIRRRPATLWRYQEALPFTPTYTGWQTVTMGEGFTPLIPLKGHSSRVFFKLDYLMPTLSFKDRGAVVLIAKAQELGVTHLVADSSGNAGTAIAAYAARADITCDIYVPSSASAKKLKQIAAHGATVHPIPGTSEGLAEGTWRSVFSLFLLSVHPHQKIPIARCCGKRLRMGFPKPVFSNVQCPLQKRLSLSVVPSLDQEQSQTVEAL